MELGRDEDKTSTLRTTLTITADFPPNQNRGIAPIFVKTYDGHSTSFNLESVTDEQGAALEYHWEGDELRIGNADVYVSGLKTYVITYTQRNVTRYYADTNKDEFYWDAIGTEWRVPIEQARVSLSLGAPTWLELNSTELQCYAGVFQSSASCGEVAEGAGSYTVQLTNIGNGQGATVALGFEPGTFKIYEPSLWEKIMQWCGQRDGRYVPVPGHPHFTHTLVFKVGREEKGAQADCPRVYSTKRCQRDYGSNTWRAVRAHTGFGSDCAADRSAVRHYIKIYETQPKRSFLQPAKYEIEVQQDLGNLRAEEREIVSDMGLNQVGSKIDLSTLRHNMTYATRAVDDHEKVQKLIDGTYGLREKNPEFKTRFRRRAIWLLLLGAVLLSPNIGLTVSPRIHVVIWQGAKRQGPGITSLS